MAKISETRPTILNRMKMRIILNKQDWVKMEATYPEPLRCHPYQGIQY